MSTAHLVLLAGGNPLPIYLAAATLAPREVSLLCSSETRLVAERLAEALRDRCEAGVDVVVLEDPWDAGEVGSALRRVLRPDSHLDYTGGTKVMAAGARLALGTGAGAACRASQVVERGGFIRYDDGRRSRWPATSTSTSSCGCTMQNC